MSYPCGVADVFSSSLQIMPRQPKPLRDDPMFPNTIPPPQFRDLPFKSRAISTAEMLRHIDLTDPHAEGIERALRQSPPVAYAIDPRRGIIVISNTNRVYMPIDLNEHPIERMYRDGRYGHHDQQNWPQRFLNHQPWMAACPQYEPPHNNRGGDPLWYSPCDDDLIMPDEDSETGRPDPELVAIFEDAWKPLEQDVQERAPWLHAIHRPQSVLDVGSAALSRLQCKDHMSLQRLVELIASLQRQMYSLTGFMTWFYLHHEALGIARGKAFTEEVRNKFSMAPRRFRGGELKPEDIMQTRGSSTDDFMVAKFLAGYRMPYFFWAKWKFDCSIERWAQSKRAYQVPPQTFENLRARHLLEYDAAAAAGFSHYLSNTIDDDDLDNGIDFGGTADDFEMGDSSATAPSAAPTPSPSAPTPSTLAATASAACIVSPRQDIMVNGEFS